MSLVCPTPHPQKKAVCEDMVTRGGGGGGGGGGGQHVRAKAETGWMQMPRSLQTGRNYEARRGPPQVQKESNPCFQTLSLQNKEFIINPCCFKPPMCVTL